MCVSPSVRERGRRGNVGAPAAMFGVATETLEFVRKVRQRLSWGQIAAASHHPYGAVRIHFDDVAVARNTRLILHAMPRRVASDTSILERRMSLHQRTGSVFCRRH